MKKRRICILTQPLSYGYGGLLQAYALEKVLKEEGHIVYHEDRKHNSSYRHRFIKYLKALLAPIYGPLLTQVTGVHYSSNSITRRIYKATDDFKRKYLNVTEPIFSNSKKEFEKYEFDTYIVGSDQVWRPKYAFGKGSIYNYFLDFTKDLSVKRIAYGASFGVPDWEFTYEETKKCKELLRKFDAVSVREDIGVTQCMNHFGITAKHVLDPTLLLEKDDYIDLVKRENEKTYNEDLFYFFLDSTKEKNEIVDIIAEKKKLSPFSIMPTEYYYNVGKKHIDKCTYKSVTAWLRAYMDSKFIVTDSFHGTVFAIIFNKPFITIANKERGISRFESLLKIFGLTNRLIFDIKDITDELLSSGIDYNIVNQIKKNKKEESLHFLLSALE